jgi:hypothetical protein
MYYDIEQGWLSQEFAHSHVETLQFNQIGLYCSVSRIQAKPEG